MTQSVLFTNNGPKALSNLTLHEVQAASEKQNNLWLQRRRAMPVSHPPADIPSNVKAYILSFGIIPTEKENIFFLIWADYVIHTGYDGTNALTICSEKVNKTKTPCCTIISETLLGPSTRKRFCSWNFQLFHSFRHDAAFAFCALQ